MTNKPENNSEDTSKDQTKKNWQKSVSGGGSIPDHIKAQAEQIADEVVPASEEAENSNSQYEEEIAKYKDQALRAMAEVENIRRRSAKDVQEANEYGITNVARHLIDVMENFHRAFDSVDKDIIEDELFKGFYDGIDLTQKELQRIFEKNNISRIYPMGETFDHNFHQAVAQVPNAEAEPNTVIDVIQAGYMMKSRLLRPAMVAVAIKPV